MAAAPDTAELAQLLGAYASAVDARDLDALRALFVPDATVTVGRRDSEPQVFVGHGGLADVIGALSPFEKTLHEVSSPFFKLGPDIDEAAGESVCIAHHVREGADVVLHGRYFDRFRRDDGIWRFAARELRVLWTEKRPVRLA